MAGFLKTLRRTRKPSDADNNSDQTSVPPLLPVTFPQVLPHNTTLPHQGWSTIIQHPSLPTTFRLELTSRALFEASAAFFALPPESKQEFKTIHGSEEGWSHIPGEKEMLTLRCLERTPAALRAAAEAFWAEAGGLLKEILGRIAESLGLSADALTVFMGPGVELGTEKTATMLRLFRYEGCDKGSPRVVAEPHSDLGLLSLVLGSTPGLEVWDRDKNIWIPLEKNYPSPAATLLVGRQLERLSNGRYHPGKHRVCAYPHPASLVAASPVVPEPPARLGFRFSIVFVLRAHWPVLVNSDDLTTAITGKFADPMRGMMARELFVSIEKRCFNVNAGLQERNKQKIRLNDGKSNDFTSRTDEDVENSR